MVLDPLGVNLSTLTAASLLCGGDKHLDLLAVGADRVVRNLAAPKSYDFPGQNFPDLSRRLAAPTVD